MFIYDAFLNSLNFISLIAVFISAWFWYSASNLDIPTPKGSYFDEHMISAIKEQSRLNGKAATFAVFALAPQAIKQVVVIGSDYNFWQTAYGVLASIMNF